jgi:hypothetical protein
VLCVEGDTAVERSVSDLELFENSLSYTSFLSTIESKQLEGSTSVPTVSQRMGPIALCKLQAIQSSDVRPVCRLTRRCPLLMLRRCCYPKIRVIFSPLPSGFVD